MFNGFKIQNYSSKAIKYRDSLKVRNRTAFTALMLAIICNAMLKKKIDIKTLKKWKKREILSFVEIFWDKKKVNSRVTSDCRQ